MRVNIYDPFWIHDEEGKQRGINWEGINPLGITDLPYHLGMRYDNVPGETFSRIKFDIAEMEEVVDTYYTSKNDTGRILRGQIVENNIARDCTDDTLYYRVTDTAENSIISDTEITDYFTEISNGIFEIPLSSTITAQNCYIYFKINDIEFNKKVFVYIQDKSSIDENYITPYAVIRKDTKGQNISFKIYENYNELDIRTIKTATLYRKQINGTIEDNFALTRNITSNTLDMTISSGFASTKGSYALSLLLTFYNNKVIKIPTLGHIKLEVI